MCTYVTSHVEVAGSANGGDDWFPADRAVVYFDHPQHALLDHSLNIDFVSEQAGPTSRVAVELSAESARALVDSILAALAAGEAAHVA